MEHQRTVLPPRTDLTSRRQRVTAWVMLRGLDLYERLTSRVLVDVTPPRHDPLYRVPENLEGFRPGQVLDARPVEVRALRRVIRADAWQVKFRSTDGEGAASWGVAAVMVPRRRFRGPLRPLLSYQCAIDALGATADPSYTLRHGDQLELPFIALALRRGWAVVTTDYSGPGHAFCAFPLVARFVLDGIRAAIGIEPAGFDAATPIGLGVTRAEPSQPSSRSNDKPPTHRSCTSWAPPPAAPASTPSRRLRCSRACRAPSDS